LILLDLNLPKGEGLAFAQEILNRQIPLIMVSNRPQDKILALELGVDDYLDKPYQPRELLARIQNLLRRYQSLLPEAFHFGLFCLDPSGRRLMNAEGKEVGITRGEFDLLAALLKAKGRVLSRAQLSEIISPDGAVVSNRSVDTLVFRLRRKLADDPRCPTLLQTIPGVGYRMVV
ncbi:MAG: response regulator transcription factor, partial [Holophaga sp.]